MDWEQLKKEVDDFVEAVKIGLAPADEDAGPNFGLLSAMAKEIQRDFESRPRFPKPQMRQECWDSFQAARSALARAGQEVRDSRPKFRNLR